MQVSSHSKRLLGWLALVGAMIALGYSATGEPPEDVLYLWETFVGSLIAFALIGLLLFWIVYGGPASELLALRRPRSWGAALGWVTLIFIGVIVLAAGLEPVLHGGEEQGLVPDEWDADRAAPYAANAAATAVLVPVVEEFLFRGAGYSLLLRYGRPAAIGGTAVLFGLAHGLVLLLPVLVAFGVGLAWLRARTGSIYPCILLHGCFNALSVTVAVFV